MFSRSKPSRIATEAETGVPDPRPSKASAGEAISAIVKTLFGLIALLVTVGVLVGLVLTMTVMPFVKVNDSYWAVKWAAWPQGQVPPASIVYSTSKPVPGDLMSRIDLLTGGYTGALSQVLAGPLGEVSTDENLNILVDGQDTGYASPTKIAPQKIGDNYLAVCLKGCATDGMIHLIPVANVVGEVMGEYRFPATIAPMPEVQAPAPASPVGTVPASEPSTPTDEEAAGDTK